MKEKIVKTGIYLIVLGLLLQLGSAFILNAFTSIMQDVGNEYSSYASNYLSYDVLNILSICIIAPLLEEIVFRFIIIGAAKKVLPENIALIIQAVLFSLYHSNLIQKIYTFLLGLILGYIFLNLGKLIASTIVHASINTFGLFLIPLIPPIKPIAAEIAVGIILLFSAILLIIHIKK